MKFVVTVEPEFGETADELKEQLEEFFLRGLNLYGKVEILKEVKTEYPSESSWEEFDS